jgi:hypothetical protein
LVFQDYQSLHPLGIGRNRRKIAAATHSLALLAACISEYILSDLLTISPNTKLTEDPHQLFLAVKEHVNAVQALWKVTHCELWGVFMGRESTFRTVKQIFENLENSRSAYKGVNCNMISMTALLVKRNFPSCPLGPLQMYSTKAKDGKHAIGDKVWIEMRSEPMESI